MPVKRLIQSKKAWLSVVLVLSVLGFTFGLFGGCGSDYNTPASLTETSTSLITATDLNGWMGLVNSSGYNNVVILDINSSSTNYYAPASGHIPGAYFVNTSEITATRSEGVGVSTKYMVPDGAMMDDLIQRTGIGANTTIVFTSSSTTSFRFLSTSMAYFAFRYWGFPKNRLKILDGYNAQWVTAGYTLTTVDPPVANSGYSVRNNASLRTDLRASFLEMIDVVEGKVPNAVIIRASSSIGTSTPFTGDIKNAQILAYTNLISGVLYDTAGLNGAFTGIGLDSSKTAYIYCNSSYMAAVTFFALDGILGWPAALYKGSWFQWGQMADNANPTNSKGIDTNSPWRTDTTARSASIVYNPVAGVSRYPSPPLSFDATVNEIEQEDAEYMGTGSGGGAGGGGTPGC